LAKISTFATLGPHTLNCPTVSPSTATDVEKELCYQLTTGWGDGIDVATWNALNQAYYSRSLAFPRPVA
jgi:hypothetical protein